MIETRLSFLTGVEAVFTAKQLLPRIEINNISGTRFKQRVYDLAAEIANYFRVSPHIHIPNSVLFLTSVAAWQLDLPGKEGILGVAVGLGADNLLMAGNNLAKYRRIRALLSQRGWDRRLIKPMTATLCSRNAARVAAIDAGYEENITKLYEETGMNGILPL